MAHMKIDGDNITAEDYEAQLADGFRKLSFKKPLERQFRLHRLETIVTQLRVILILGFLFGIAVMTVDYFLIDGIGFRDPNTLARTAISHTLLATMIAVTFIPWARIWLAPLAVLIGLSIVGTSLFMRAAGTEQAMGPAFAGFIVLTFYVYLFVGLRFWPAVITALGIAAIIIGSEIGRGTAGSHSIHNYLFLLFANLIGAAGLYNLEHSQRLSFLETRLREKVATLDHLTGLANREHFDRFYGEVWRHCARHQQPLAIALLDLDHFKDYNDTYGHQAGDRCLRQVADVIKSACRRPLDIAARYGGEEFVLVLPESTLDHAHLALSQLVSRVEALNLEHRNSPTAPRVTISGGVAHAWPHTGEYGPEGLLQLADEALYSAKGHGRNRVYVYQPENDRSNVSGIFSRTVDFRRERSA